MDESQQVRRLARGGIGGLAVSVVSGFAGIAFVMVTTRGFERADAGLVFAVTSIFLVCLAVVELGADIGTVRFVARYLAQGERLRAGLVLRVALGPVLLLAVMVAAGGIWAVTQIQDGSRSSTTGWIEPAVIVLAGFLPVAALSDSVLAATRGLGTVKPTIVADGLLRQGLQPVLGAIVVATTHNPVWMVVAWVLPYAVSLAVGAYSLRQLAQRNCVPLFGRVSRDELRFVAREVWRFNAPRTVTQVAQMAIRRADIPIVAALAGPAAASIYTAASRFVTVGQMGIKGIQQMVGPQIARFLGENRPEAALVTLHTATVWSVVIAWPVYLACFAAPELLLRLFGEGYQDGVPVVIILSIAMLIGTGAGPVDIALLMSGRSIASMVNNLIALSLNLVLNLALIPVWGIQGAAVAWAASIVIGNLLPAWQIRTELGATALNRSSAMAAVIAIVSLAVLPTIGWSVGAGPEIRFFALMIGLVAYGALVFVFRQPLRLSELVGAFRRRTATQGPPG